MAGIGLVVVDIPGLRHARKPGFKTGSMTPPGLGDFGPRPEREIGWIATRVLRLAAEAAGRQGFRFLAHSILPSDRRG